MSSTIGDLATAALILSVMHKDVPDEWEHSVAPAEFRRWELREKLHEAWKLEHERILNPPAPPTPVLPLPAAQPRPSVLRPAPSETDGDGPALPDSVETGSLGDDYDHWVILAEEVGRNPADFVRQWFRDIEGGWEKSEGPVRIAQYRKAIAYYRNKNAAHGGGEIDTTRCFKCGAKGIEKHRRDNNALYYECSNDDCGFTRDDGWVPTRWDPESWQQKRDRLEQSRRRGQQRSGGGGGRSYGGRGNYGGRRQ